MLPLALLLFATGADPARVTPNVLPSACIEIKASVGDLVTLTGSAGSTWTLAEGSCGFWPDGAVCRVGLLAGGGRFIVLETVGGEVKRHAVCFGPPNPMPPGPGPAPVPVPPTPVPPAPVDPLKATLMAAFNADTGDLGQKKEDALELAAIYTAGASGCFLIATDDAGKPILDKNGAQTFAYATPKALFDAIRKVGNGTIGDRLHGLRTTFQVELQGILKNTTDPFTDASRKATADLFKRAEVILEALGKPTK